MVLLKEEVKDFLTKKNKEMVLLALEEALERKPVLYMEIEEGGIIKGGIIKDSIIKDSIIKDTCNLNSGDFTLKVVTASSLYIAYMQTIHTQSLKADQQVVKIDAVPLTGKKFSFDTDLIFKKKVLFLHLEEGLFMLGDWPGETEKTVLGDLGEVMRALQERW